MKFTAAESDALFLHLNSLFICINYLERYDRRMMNFSGGLFNSCTPYCYTHTLGLSFQLLVIQMQIGLGEKAHSRLLLLPLNYAVNKRRDLHLKWFYRPFLWRRFYFLIVRGHVPSDFGVHSFTEKTGSPKPTKTLSPNRSQVTSNLLWYFRVAQF